MKNLNKAPERGQLDIMRKASESSKAFLFFNYVFRIFEPAWC